MKSALVFLAVIGAGVASPYWGAPMGPAPPFGGYQPAPQPMQWGQQPPPPMMMMMPFWTKTAGFGASLFTRQARDYGAELIDEPDRVGYKAKIPGAESHFVTYRSSNSRAYGGNGGNGNQPKYGAGTGGGGGSAAQNGQHGHQGWN